MEDTLVLVEKCVGMIPFPVYLISLLLFAFTKPKSLDPLALLVLSLYLLCFLVRFIVELNDHADIYLSILTAVSLGLI